MAPKRSYSEYEDIHRKISRKLPLKLYLFAGLACFLILLLFKIL